ncbi:TlpA family protein disulfide reductase [Flavobacterium branchiicola]|uniref:TlpA family protein disulfide reductase n=1 Tax=Flavobacterium branchiicola TaxID=1114875 RepID=A0ABV9PG23_9FLAO|nr:TlpA disulfide reductase family protein [Flavobacterium branchiicola]MBS7254942.1 TlpA family protein disulfide reductase [Flavobacterium branchiicola]
MLKKAILFYLFNCSLIYSQAIVTVHGNILAKEAINDSITFVEGLFSGEKYYENKVLKAKITNNIFNLDFSSPYPQMYMLALDSEKNSGRFRIDCCFIDNTTTEITFDSSYILEKSNGVTNEEFLEKFIPYVFKEKKGSFNFYNFDENLDKKLYSYINENPDSYVALWFLIGRFNLEGYNEVYEKSLHSFSKKMKNEKLWKILDKELSDIKIKVNHKFPEIVLKNIDLIPELVLIPEAEYTLIDFWFSRCLPCLQEIPKWVDLYQRFGTDGLNIIGISTDKTENIEKYWQKRIIEKQIPWKNYLDENAVFASKEKIFSFPTNYLLNSKGEIIRKNIRPEELEKLLIDSYKIKKYFDSYHRQYQVPVSIY